MITFLAILSLATFGFAIPFLFIDLNKSVNDMTLRNKEWEDLKKEKDAAEAAGNYEMASELEEQIEINSLGLLGKLFLMVSGCCLYVIAGFGHWVMEIIVTIIALTNKIGNPVFGYVVLGVMIFLIFYAFLIVTPRVKAEKAKAEEYGNIYFTKTDWFSKILGFVPDIYALYVFLILIGVLSYGL